MDVGIEVCAQHPAGEDMTSRVRDLVEQVRLGREIGFRTITVAQHYLASPLQMLQPLPLLGRLAADSGEMRLGTCILLLGLLHPVDVAEQVATLDAITGGRVRLGVGLGYRGEEFDAFGVPAGQRVRRFVNNLTLVTRLLNGESVSAGTDRYVLREARLTLVPARRPPIWIGANSDAAVRRAARLGDAWVLNPHARLDALERQIREVYRPALAEAGKPFPTELPMRREVYVARDRATAIREASPWLFPKYQTYVAWGQDGAMPRDDALGGEFDELLRDRFVLGSPEECRAELSRYEERLGVTEVIVRVQWPGMPQLQAMQAIEQVGQLVPSRRAP
ncbi:MAG TPA: LLM class flavin-dependent oxidoreductase [Chloroflexota bacterium]|nr:LLM class flavin-dependent oxidoreductase [Chloroflexota bacterium]